MSDVTRYTDSEMYGMESVPAGEFVLFDDYQALREELVAVKAAHDAMELTYMTTKQPLNKIKADAILDALHQWSQCSEKNLRANLRHHANQVKQGQ